MATGSESVNEYSMGGYRMVFNSPTFLFNHKKSMGENMKNVIFKGQQIIASQQNEIIILQKDTIDKFPKINEIVVAPSYIGPTIIVFYDEEHKDFVISSHRRFDFLSNLMQEWNNMMNAGNKDESDIKKTTLYQVCDVLRFRPSIKKSWEHDKIYYYTLRHHSNKTSELQLPSNSKMEMVHDLLLVKVTKNDGSNDIIINDKLNMTLDHLPTMEESATIFNELNQKINSVYPMDGFIMFLKIPEFEIADGYKFNRCTIKYVKPEYLIAYKEIKSYKFSNNALYWAMVNMASKDPNDILREKKTEENEKLFKLMCHLQQIYYYFHCAKTPQEITKRCVMLAKSKDKFIHTLYCFINSLHTYYKKRLVEVKEKNYGRRLNIPISVKDVFIVFKDIPLMFKCMIAWLVTTNFKPTIDIFEMHCCTCQFETTTNQCYMMDSITEFEHMVPKMRVFLNMK